MGGLNVAALMSDAPAAGGLGAFLKGALDNKMLLQFLAATGADLLGNTPGKNLFGAYSQNLASQQWWKVMSAMMRGEVPADHKLTTTHTQDGTEMKFSIPKSMPSPFTSADEGVPAQMNVPYERPTQTSATTFTGNPGGVSTGDRYLNAWSGLNPFALSLPNIPASDLAGVSPEMLSQAMYFRMGQQQLAQKSVTDMADMLYRQGMLSVAERNAAVAERGAGTDEARAFADLMRSHGLYTKDMRGDALDQPFPVSVPGVGQVTTRQWNALTNPQQEYALYVHGALKENPDAQVLSPEKYQALQPTDREKFLRKAMADPELMAAAEKLAKAGALTLGQKVEQATALIDVEARAQLSNPIKLTDSVNKYMNSDAVKNSFLRFYGDPEQLATEKAVAKGNYVKNMIEIAGGKILNTTLSPDGKTAIWTVQWPPAAPGEKMGKPEIIRYAVRD